MAVHKSFTECSTTSIDRFIPHRPLISVDDAHYRLNNYTTLEEIEQYLRSTDVTSQTLSHWSKNVYKAKLKEVFGISDRIGESILPLSLNPCYTGNVNRNPSTIITSDWPVYPRCKPSIRSSICVLDLPDINKEFCCNVMHWGRNNFLTACLYDSIYLWNAPMSKVEKIIHLKKEATAIRWNNSGTHLMFAQVNPGRNSIKVWDFLTQKILYRFSHNCQVQPYCYVTSIDWHPYDKHVILGCESGKLSCWSSNLQMIKQWRGHTLEMVKITFSPNGKYVATSCMASYVKIWSFPSLQLYFRYYCHYPAKGVCWHPWNPSYICIGTLVGTLILLNVSQKVVLHKVSLDNVYLYDLTFNRLTAELIVSLHKITEPTGNNSTSSPVARHTQIEVLSSFNCVVDRIVSHTKRVQYLLWSPCNRILATAGNDETLQLWNFLPRRKRKYSSNSDDPEPQKKFCESLRNLEKYIR